MSRDPYPLQWPDGWKRTPASARRRSAFKTALFPASVAVRDELARIHARSTAITTEMPTRTDGLPYASARLPEDPGVAVWWIDDEGHEKVVACDVWDRIEANMRAIGASLEAVRGLERWGASEMSRRAYAGFTALPPGSSGTMPSGPKPWREVLGGSWPALDRSELLALAKARHRKQIEEAHPDRGGDDAFAAELNAALDRAKAELG